MSAEGRGRPEGSYDAWSEDEKMDFRRALRARHERQVRAGRAIGLGLIAIVSAGVLLHLSEDWWVPAVGALALAGLVLRLVNWKCPACGERLSARRLPRTCPGCGAPLE
jgi:rubrerythrin